MNLHSRVSRNRIGVTVAELLVAASLLTAGIAFIAQGAVQIKRLMQDIRHYQLALDELVNQLERLTALPSNERKLVMENIQPSKEIQAILGDVLVKASEIRDEDGDRIEMSIQWLRGSPAVPLTLTGWIHQETPAKSPIAERRNRSVSSESADASTDGVQQTANGRQP